MTNPFDWKNMTSTIGRDLERTATNRRKASETVELLRSQGKEPMSINLANSSKHGKPLAEYNVRKGRKGK